MRILYITAAGRADPVRAALGLHLAVNGSAQAGQEAEVILAGDATDVLLGDTIDTLEPLGLEPLRDLVAKARDRGVAIHA